MISRFSCTTENTSRNTSDAAIRVTDAIRQASENRSNEKLARISRVRIRIKDLEARGFIKRQEFYAPTTADFERRLSCHNRKTADISKVKGKA